MSERPSLVITNRSLTESAIAAALGRGGVVPYLFNTLNGMAAACVARMPKRMPGFVRRHGGRYDFRSGETDVSLLAKPRGIVAELRQGEARLTLEIVLFEDEYVGRISEIESLFRPAETMMADLADGWPSTRPSEAR